MSARSAFWKAKANDRAAKRNKPTAPKESNLPKPPVDVITQQREAKRLARVIAKSIPDNL